MELLLQWEGCDVAAFAEPAAALDYLRSNIVDLALVDWNMPGMTGGEFLQEAGAFVLPLFAPRFVVFSGDVGCRSQCDGLDVWGFLPKPFRPEMLAQILRPGVTMPDARVASSAGPSAAPSAA